MVRARSSPSTRCHPARTTTPLGAVALARLAVDPSLTLADAVIATEPSRVVEPQWDALRAEEFLERWGRAADCVIERSER